MCVVELARLLDTFLRLRNFWNSVHHVDDFGEKPAVARRAAENV
jgi:hypothetical protein